MNPLRLAGALIAPLLIIGCTSIVAKYDTLYGPAAPKNRVMSETQKGDKRLLSYTNDVQPILAQRCVVCHACYDAPCQLNLTSGEGVDRGATKAPVYNGARFIASEPTRLGVDATTTQQWRDMGFHPVLNERTENQQINLDQSLLYQMLILKRRNPLPTEGRLPEEFDVGTKLHADEGFSHSQQCPSIETFPKFAVNHPQWGMRTAYPIADV